MICATLSGSTVVVSDPTPASSCPAGTYSLMTSSEFELYMVSPWKLNIDEAQAIVGAILMLWAAGWGVRMVIQALRERASSVVDNDE